MGMKQNSVQQSYQEVMAVVGEATAREDMLDSIEPHGGLHETMTK